jgi:stage V sporulation protein G
MAKNQTAATNPASAQAGQLPVNYDVRILSTKQNGATLAAASVNINGVFAVRGVKVMDSDKGPFVSMPRYKAGNGEYKDICFPCTKESREQFNQAVLSAYEHALVQRRQDTPEESSQGQSAAPAMSM